MLKAIMAIDEDAGVSRLGSMPWPKNSKDLQWFKRNTINQVVIMGRLTWIDPKMPTPLIKRINILVTSKDKKLFPGADSYISGNLRNSVKEIIKKYPNLDKWLIGGPNLVNQLFDLIDTFYITRIYGKFDCDKKLNIQSIEENMKLDKTIKSDNKCHFEIWKR